MVRGILKTMPGLPAHLSEGLLGSHRPFSPAQLDVGQYGIQLRVQVVPAEKQASEAFVTQVGCWQPAGGLEKSPRPAA